MKKNQSRTARRVTLQTSITESERARRLQGYTTNRPIEPIDRYKNVSSHAGKPIPKGSSLFIFNIRGQYTVNQYHSDLGEIAFDCIALNHPNAKDKFHRWLKENLNKTVFAKTSSQWYKEVPEEIGLKIIDTAGGWDQKDFEHAWEKELVTKNEFKYNCSQCHVTIANPEAFKTW